MFGFLRRGRGLLLENHAELETRLGDAVRGAVHAIPESEPVYTALKLCLTGHTNIPVTDKRGEAFRGMINSRNLLDFLGGGSLYQAYVAGKRLDIPVARIMQTGFREIERATSLGQALGVFKKTGNGVHPLVSRGRLDGMVTEGDIVSQISRATGVSVWEVMTRKPAVARVEHPVCDVAGMLVRGGYSRLPVVRDAFLTGIVTPLDIIAYLNRNRNLGGLRRDRSELEKAMNKAVSTVEPHADVCEAVGTMREKGVAMLPVVDEYQVLGVLTQRDILEVM
ncbi:MAG: CBS domain-containing protein [Candidatus Aenigmarchaeota archaeon]|nr:CBS domain-containing protein [Candidatus Aenigmarchaeota archaeon]